FWVPPLFQARVPRAAGGERGRLAGESLAYAQLNARRNRLGPCLSQAGGGPESLVGLCVERSIERVVALLGVLKAGGAYLPLDPAYPPERLAFMLEDAKVSLLLTEAALPASLPAHQVEVLCLEQVLPLAAGESPL